MKGFEHAQIFHCKVVMVVFVEDAYFPRWLHFVRLICTWYGLVVNKLKQEWPPVLAITPSHQHHVGSVLSMLLQHSWWHSCYVHCVSWLNSLQPIEFGDTLTMLLQQPIHTLQALINTTPPCLTIYHLSFGCKAK